MKLADWLGFFGPILIAVIVAVTPYLRGRAELRDKRAQIRADLDLVGLLPDNMYGRDVLMTSIDRRVRLLATTALPRAWRLGSDHTRERVQYNLIRAVLAVMLVFSYVYAWWIADSWRDRLLPIAVIFACGAGLLWLRSLLDKLDVKETTRLHSEELAQFTERMRQRDAAIAKLVEDARRHVQWQHWVEQEFANRGIQLPPAPPDNFEDIGLPEPIDNHESGPESNES
ncbi:hypothetical protein [Nocardia sp. NPDC057030]|uniref:hypothetical protein n=1 Tax=unclassified Nocardia TaxID=2637762 RepID=UPI00363B5912